MVTAGRGLSGESPRRGGAASDHPRPPPRRPPAAHRGGPAWRPPDPRPGAGTRERGRSLGSHRALPLRALSQEPKMMRWVRSPPVSPRSPRVTSVACGARQDCGPPRSWNPCPRRRGPGQPPPCHRSPRQAGSERLSPQPASAPDPAVNSSSSCSPPATPAAARGSAAVSRAGPASPRGPGGRCRGSARGWGYAPVGVGELCFPLGSSRWFCPCPAQLLGADPGAAGATRPGARGDGGRSPGLGGVAVPRR
ncbi:translation initiation factor IF-2-like [Corvus cornix cornix]|uniref:translation initiation factor IF-2-like n=1 Tax=Corvus cornix cornix TaxID=932674 RepID=UPI0019526DA9|nr:translation initiation factor IF-2-like [Corvus cornix cornix]